MKKFLAYLLMSHLRFFEGLNGSNRAAAEIGAWRSIVYSFLILCMATVSPLALFMLSLGMSLIETNTIALGIIYMGVALIASVLLTLPVWCDYEGFIRESEIRGIEGSRLGLLLFPTSLLVYIFVVLLFVCFYIN